MAKKSFRCRVVTPAAMLVDDAISYASIPAWDGLFGVMPGRAPILARLGTGPLRLDFADTSKGEGGTRSFLVEGGFVRMAGDELTVLAERATPAESITVAQAEGELKSAATTAERALARTKVRMVKSRQGI